MSYFANIKIKEGIYFNCKKLGTEGVYTGSKL
jgi:hypothetical protein